MDGQALLVSLVTQASVDGQEHRACLVGQAHQVSLVTQV